MRILICLTTAVLAGFGAPRLNDTTAAPWRGDTNRDFTLVIDRPFLTSVDTVRLRYARHRWPGFDAANVADAVTQGSVPQVPTGDGSGALTAGWKATGTDLATAPVSHHLFYQWQVDYTQPFGLGSGTALSPVLDMVIGCTPEMIATQLRSMQQAMLFSAHNTSDPIKSTFPYLPHGFGSIENTGVGFAFVGVAVLWQFPGYPTSLEPAAPSSCSTGRGR